jgi:hypothetical protein
MNECKKKLGNVLGKFDKLNEIYNSEGLERVLYETVKLESAVKETHESTAKITFEYQSNTQRYRFLYVGCGKLWSKALGG